MENKYMRAAINEAKKCEIDGEVPIGAVIVKDGKIIASGRNRRETGKNALYHAEIEAIDKACRVLGGWRLFECDLYVTLEPCPMCAGAIINSRIKTVYFGAYDSKTGSFGSAADFNRMSFNHKPGVIGGVMEDECSALISGFFKNLRKIKSERKENADSKDDS